jgi:hypothetical protein
LTKNPRIVSPSTPSLADAKIISLMQVSPISMMASELIMPKTLKTRKKEK